MPRRARSVALVAVLLLVSAATTGRAQDPPKPPPPSKGTPLHGGGIVTVPQEYNTGLPVTPKYQQVQVTPTGDNDQPIAISDADKKSLTGKFSSTAASTSVTVNPAYFDSNLQKNVDVEDYHQVLAIAASPTNTNLVAVNDTSIEAYYFDKSTSMFVTLNVFDVIGAQYGDYKPLAYPILFNDNDGTSTVSGANMLYEYIEMNTFTSNLPSFTDGGTFSFTGGNSAALPGVLLSTTPFTFDPTTGPVGTGFTGTAFVGDVSSVTVVPEPASIALLVLGAAGVTASARGTRGHLARMCSGRASR